MPSDPSLTELRAKLRANNSALAAETDALVQNVTPILWHSIATFPSGTSHTPDHTATVEQIASMLVPPEILAQLNDDELQLLILACHFHDLGMAGTEFDNKSEESRDQARRDHAIRIGDRIREDWQKLGFRDANVAAILSEVCRGHRPKRPDGTANWLDIDENRIVAPGRTVRVRTVSALIYAADELHIGADRATGREQDWLEIAEEEARKHWKRHQCINGPVIIAGRLRLEASVASSALEGDLRRSVFLKAFSAIRDANAQITADGIEGQLRQVEVKWLREDLWRLLLISVQSSQEPRTDAELIDLVKQRFEDESKGFDDLSSLCSQIPATIDDSGIAKTIEDFHKRSWLVESSTPMASVLNSDVRPAEQFFKIARKADVVDILFGGRFSQRHEFDLLRSEFGRAFVNGCVVPIVESGFGVKLGNDQPEASVLTVLRSAPTASRLVTNNAPAPSVLVKKHLLQVSALHGGLADLLRHPDLILSKDFRHAIRRLSKLVVDNQASFLRFIEELALVGGYSFEQIHEAISHSDSAMKQWTNKDEDGVDSESTKINISQSVPTDISPMAISLPYLLLTQSRTGLPIELVNTEEAPFKVKVRTQDKSVLNEHPSMMTFGPSRRQLPPQVTFRGSMTVSLKERSIELLVEDLHQNNDRSLPVLINVPGTTLQEAGNATTRFDYYLPAFNAQLLKSLYLLQQQIGTESVKIRMVRNKDEEEWGAIEATKAELDSLIPQPFERSVVDYLAELGTSTQLPWWISDEELSVLADPSADRRELFDRYASQTSDDKVEIDSVVLRFATEHGHEYMEEWLRFLPGFTSGFSFGDDEFDRGWKEGLKEMMIAASFADDIYALADFIREWARDPSTPFPFNVSSTAPVSPVSKTRFEIIRYPRIDRFWFVERPVVLRLRPLLEVEAWEVERAYWSSIAENDRADILGERIEEAKAKQDDQPKPSDES